MPLLTWLTEIDESWTSFLAWLCIRVFYSIFATRNMLQADQWWQSTEIAYALVYGIKPAHLPGGEAVPTNQPLPWEWRPEYGLRTVIFPYVLAAPLWLLKQAGLDFNGHVLVLTH